MREPQGRGGQPEVLRVRVGNAGWLLPQCRGKSCRQVQCLKRVIVGCSGDPEAGAGQGQAPG